MGQASRAGRTGLAAHQALDLDRQMSKLVEELVMVVQEFGIVFPHSCLGLVLTFQVPILTLFSEQKSQNVSLVYSGERRTSEGLLQLIKVNEFLT
jgi:hypothetical protein